MSGIFSGNFHSAPQYIHNRGVDNSNPETEGFVNVVSLSELGCVLCSPGRTRTYNQLLNRELRYHCATGECTRIIADVCRRQKTSFSFREERFDVGDTDGLGEVVIKSRLLCLCLVLVLPVSRHRYQNEGIIPVLLAQPP